MKEPFPKSLSDRPELVKATLMDPAIHIAAMNGTSLDDIIWMLVQHKKGLIERIAQLELLTPKRINTPDGKSYIWHCPDEMVP